MTRLSAFVSVQNFCSCLQHSAFLWASSLQLLICVSVRTHKQGLMQWQHFSILFLNQLIINIDHRWVSYYLSYTFPYFLLILFFLPSSVLISAKLCSRPYREKEKMGQSHRGSSRAHSYWNKSGARNREVLEALFLWYNSTALMAQ